jgi:hypothetical protein
MCQNSLLNMGKKKKKKNKDLEKMQIKLKKKKNIILKKIKFDKISKLYFNDK